MKRLVFVFVLSAFAVGSASAQSCVTKAVSKDGKPLAGAAKTGSIKKCCEDSAVSKDGKPLAEQQRPASSRSAKAAVDAKLSRTSG